MGWKRKVRNPKSVLGFFLKQLSDVENPGGRAISYKAVTRDRAALGRNEEIQSSAGGCSYPSQPKPSLSSGPLG